MNNQTPKSKRCQYCDQAYVWYAQYVGEDTPTFYFPGSHIRGFGIIKVCDAHRDALKEASNVVAS